MKIHRVGLLPFTLLFGGAHLLAQTNTFPSSGNVGIGTTNPDRALQVNGAIAARGTNPSYGFVGLVPGYSSYAGYVEWYNAGGSRLGYLGYLDLAGGQNNLGLNLENSANFVVGGGSVGIGTANPRSLLQVTGAITAGSAGSTSGVDYLYGLYGDGKIFVIGSQYSSSASFLAYGVKAKPGATGYLSSTGIPIGRSAFEANNGYLAFWTGSTQTSADGGAVSITERMRIDSSGNVGIGTYSPEARLQVALGVVGESRITIGDGTTGGWSNIVMRSGATKRGWLIGAQTNIDQGFEITPSATDGGATFSNPALVVRCSGNVGIGTAAPTHKLAVAGAIRAKEVIVDTGWSDYVFADDYRLAPLSEVERHIKAEKHLPGIPSAAEVAKDGVSVGEMQAKLLAQIEQLTLRQIAQEKRIAALETQNAELRKQIESPMHSK